MATTDWKNEVKLTDAEKKVIWGKGTEVGWLVCQRIRSPIAPEASWCWRIREIQAKGGSLCLQSMIATIAWSLVIVVAGVQDTALQRTIEI
jgi:hypothetical protein